tara:strand:+ start:108 stop:365 length:258 start_codon:yes stop_codon:yes gene_type:complete
MNKDVIREEIIKAQSYISKCSLIINATPKQKERNKDSFYRDLFRAVVKDHDLRDDVNNFIFDLINKPAPKDQSPAEFILVKESVH